jgi:hypothetical protein
MAQNHTWRHPISKPFALPFLISDLESPITNLEHRSAMQMNS